MKLAISAALAGLIFALGLGLSGMTQPQKVIGFLDVTGAWDPSLAFVMGAALLTYGLSYRLIARRRAPLFAAKFSMPHRTDLDARLITGAALFGIGWGIAGFCPGPALTSLVTGALPALAFVAAMLTGMGLYKYGLEPRLR